MKALVCSEFGSTEDLELEERDNLEPGRVQQTIPHKENPPTPREDNSLCRVTCFWAEHVLCLKLLGVMQRSIHMKTESKHQIVDIG